MHGNTFLSPHFSLLEMTESQTARKHGIENVPKPKEVENLKRLCKNVLEPLREAMQLPVVITSGYRCKRLNELLVHAARKSQHMVGCAADFYVGQGRVPSSRFQVPSHRDRLIMAFRHIIEQLDFDQLILYPTFIHVSFVSKDANRHYIMTANGSGHYRRISKETAHSFV